MKSTILFRVSPWLRKPPGGPYQWKKRTKPKEWLSKSTDVLTISGEIPEARRMGTLAKLKVETWRRKKTHLEWLRDTTVGWCENMGRWVNIPDKWWLIDELGDYTTLDILGMNPIEESRTKPTSKMEWEGNFEHCSLGHREKQGSCWLTQSPREECDCMGLLGWFLMIVESTRIASNLLSVGLNRGIIRDKSIQLYYIFIVLETNVHMT